MDDHQKPELRTLTFGKMVSRTCKTAASHYGTFFAAYLLTTSVIFIVLFAMFRLTVPAVIEASQYNFALTDVFLPIAGSILITLVALFFSEQFSTGLVVATVKEHENGNKLSLSNAFSLAKRNYGNVTRTIWALVLCSMGLGIVAIPLGLLSLIPFVGVLVIICISFGIEILYDFCICAAATDNKAGFNAIGFGAKITFSGGFFLTLFHMFVASVIVGGIVVVFAMIAVPSLIMGSLTDITQMQWLVGSGAWYAVMVLFWVITSALSPFATVFIYYIYANARIRTANRMYKKMVQAQNERGESWEAYKADEAGQRWQEHSKGCHDFGEDTHY